MSARELLRRLGRSLMRTVKRFFSNTPANSYEAAVFGAVRQIAYNIGRTAI